MRLFAVTLLAAFAVTAALAKIELDDGVLVVTKDNFKEAVEENDFVLVEFYAPWCGHCKALAPEYAKAAKKLEESGSTIKLAKVDATEESELAEKHNIRGYPTLKFYHKGNMIDYTGGRQADDIITWLEKKTGPGAKDLPTLDDVKAFIDAHNVAIVGFFKDAKSKNAVTFLDVGTLVDDHVFGITSNEEIFKEYGVEDGKIVLFKKFDEGKVEYPNDEVEVQSLQKFISIQALPLVIDFNQDTAEKVFNGNIKSHLLVFLSQSAGHYDKYVDQIKEPAKKFREQVLFVTINIDVRDHDRILEFFGMKEDDIPVMRLIKLEKDMDKYKPEKPDLTSENILEFVTAFVEGKLVKQLLSQDLPEDWDKNPVKVLVSSNFHEVAHDKTKNVLVEFYAPWCGHCKELAPVYEKLAVKYKDTEDLVIAKMDATANELEDMPIANYPTIMLFKKDTNEAVEYNEERTLEQLSKFIDSNGAYGQAPQEAQEEDEDDDVPRKDEL